MCEGASAPAERNTHNTEQSSFDSPRGCAHATRIALALTHTHSRLTRRFVRLNNHEHTDIAEYIGTYVAGRDGGITFVEGALVTAVRKGHWIVLDELNLAPSDVLEALNRLLDDNRELYIPELQQTVREVVRISGQLCTARSRPACDETTDVECAHGGRTAPPLFGAPMLRAAHARLPCLARPALWGIVGKGGAVPNGHRDFKTEPQGGSMRRAAPACPSQRWCCLPVPARSELTPLSPLQIKPHPHFMLFATQNPPGTYGGRKVCCRLAAASHAARGTRNAWDANLLVLWETPPSGGH